MTNSLLIAALSLSVTVSGEAPALNGVSALTEGRETPPVQRLDATAFFERLVERYRSLRAYRDLTSVVQVTREADRGAAAETRRTETQIICDVLEGELRIVTPGSQLREALAETFGLNVRLRTGGALGEGSAKKGAAGLRNQDSKASSDGADAESGGQPGRRGASFLESSVSDLAARYNLWLAPHLSLKFANDPLGEFRAAAHEPFTATDASAVTVDDRVMVHVELKSGRASASPAGGPDAPDDFDTKFDLYVNPESMLIERIEGQERLPDGGRIETTYTITPIVATTVESSPERDSGGGEAGAVEQGDREEVEPTIGAPPAIAPPPDTPAASSCGKTSAGDETRAPYEPRP